MNEVFLKTRELGEAIMRSDEYKRMKDFEEKAMHNEDAAVTMGKFMECRQKVETLLQEDRPDTDQLKELSAEMDKYQERLQMISDVQNLTEARGEFTALIEQVNKVLKFIITGEMDTNDHDEECGGSCDGCSGCGHLH